MSYCTRRPRFIAFTFGPKVRFEGLKERAVLVRASGERVAVIGEALWVRATPRDAKPAHDSHDLSDVGLLKVDVERAELAVLRGVRKEHWRRVRQVAMEVHDAEGGAKELEAIRALLLDPERGGFEPDRVVVEQPKGLEGSTLWNLYARR